MSNIKVCQAQFAVGVSSGINISHLKSSFRQEFFEGKLVNLTVGISPQYSVSDKINVVLNLEYSPKGLKQSNIMNKAKFRYTYFDVLPEIEYIFSKYLKAGLGINFGKLLNEESNINGQGWRSTKHLNNTNLNDYGLALKIQGKIRNIYISTL